MSSNSLRSECKKFAPNIFNKTKCSNCFKQKEEHSQEALECNRNGLLSAEAHSVHMPSVYANTGAKTPEVPKRLKNVYK